MRRGFARFTGLGGALLAVPADGPPVMLHSARGCPRPEIDGGQTFVAGPSAGEPVRYACDGLIPAGDGTCLTCPHPHDMAHPVAWTWLDGEPEPAVEQIRDEVRWDSSETPRMQARAAELVGAPVVQVVDSEDGRNVIATRIGQVEAPVVRAGRTAAERASKKRRALARHEAGTCAPSCPLCFRLRKSAEAGGA